jgi:hypothetical protein
LREAVHRERRGRPTAALADTDQPKVAAETPPTSNWRRVVDVADPA